MSQENTGRFIKELRTAKKLTQLELAEKIGVTDRAISKWENGRGLPDISLLVPLAKELNVSVLELLNGKRISDNDKAVIDIIQKKESIIKRWKNLFLILINIILVCMIMVLIYGYFVPKKYENSKTQHAIGILSDSMSPLLNAGDYIVYDNANINSIKENDFIVFTYAFDNRPNELSDDKLVTVHRVVKIIDDNNEVSLITRGDNNSENDKYHVTKENFIGKYNHKLPMISSFFKRNFTKFPTLIFLFDLLGIIGILLVDSVNIYTYFNKIKH